VFLAQYSNIAFIIPLSTSNLKDTFLKWTGLVDSPYTDFTQDWYEQVGFTIIITVAI